MKLKQDEYNVLRKLNLNPKDSQRELASKLGFSLGKLNYCIAALKKKGLIKVKNFSQNKNKLGYAYLLTPKGIAAKTKLTSNFMKLKMREYDELSKNLNNLKVNFMWVVANINQYYT